MPVLTCPLCRRSWSSPFHLRGVLCPVCFERSLRGALPPRSRSKPSLVRALGLLTMLGAVLAVRTFLIFSCA